MRGQDREPAKRDRPSVRPASIEDADGCAHRENTRNEERRLQSVQLSGSQGNGRSSKTQFTLSRPPRRRVITGNGDRRCQQYRQVCRSRHRKIDDESADVLDMWMQPRLSHPSGPPPCEAPSRRSNRWTCRPPTPRRLRRHARWNEAQSAGCNATTLELACEHNRSSAAVRRPGSISIGRYLAGGRSGLSAHFRAAGSCSGSSSQARQT